MTQDIESIQAEMAHVYQASGYEPATLSGHRWVRVMCDYCAGGVWNRNGAAVSPEQMPITPELALRIYRWQAWYEDLMRPEAPGPDKAHLERFSREGREIAIEVKRQLPGWTVVYFDEARLASVSPGAEGPRGWFEYEITDAMMQAVCGPQPGAPQEDPGT